MRRLWNRLLVLVAVLGLALGAFALSLRHNRFYTCEDCGSVMRVSERLVLPGSTTTWDRRRQGFATCAHRLRPGAALGTAAQNVADGKLVLVRRGKAYGGFIIERRLSSPDRAEYSWWYRADGGGGLSRSGVHTGTGACRFPELIEFGPFELTWSCGVDSSAVGYGDAPGKAAVDRELAICATDLDGITGVDAAAPHWQYRRYDE